MARGFGFYAFWALKLLVAFAFIAAAIAKLTAQPMMVDEFEVIGLGQGFRIVTGVIELVAGLLLLLPATSFWGAVLLTGISGGALIAQLGPLKGDIVHVLVLGAAVLLIGWLTRPARLR